MYVYVCVYVYIYIYIKKKKATKFMHTYLQFFIAVLLNHRIFQKGVFIKGKYFVSTLSVMTLFLTV